MLGASKVYLIGIDLLFRDQYDHFYKDHIYRKPGAEVKKANMHNIVEVEANDNKYQTTLYFKESAEFIDKVIPTWFGDIEVFDFSNGLLKSPKKLHLHEFMK